MENTVNFILQYSTCSERILRALERQQDQILLHSDVRSLLHDKHATKTTQKKSKYDRVTAASGAEDKNSKGITLPSSSVQLLLSLSQIWDHFHYSIPTSQLTTNVKTDSLAVMIIKYRFKYQNKIPEKTHQCWINICQQSRVVLFNSSKARN